MAAVGDDTRALAALREKVCEAEALLGELGAGGSPAGLVGAIHNLQAMREKAEARLVQAERIQREQRRQFDQDLAGFRNVASENERLEARLVEVEKERDERAGRVDQLGAAIVHVIEVSPGTPATVKGYLRAALAADKTAGEKLGGWCEAHGGYTGRRCRCGAPSPPAAEPGEDERPESVFAHLDRDTLEGLYASALERVVELEHESRTGLKTDGPEGSKI